MRKDVPAGVTRDWLAKNQIMARRQSLEPADVFSLPFYFTYFTLGIFPFIFIPFSFFCFIIINPLSGKK